MQTKSVPLDILTHTYVLASVSVMERKCVATGQGVVIGIKALKMLMALLGALVALRERGSSESVATPT